MTTLIIYTRHVRVKATIYHIQRLGIINVEVASNLNQSFVIISSEKRIDVVLIEQEVWNTDYEDVSVFINNLRNVKNGKGPPKLFILANCLSCGRANLAFSCVDTPIIDMKRLRASMLAASLQRVLGLGNKENTTNGQLSTLPLQNLLRGRNILVVDDNSINLKVVARTLKKYGVEVLCVDSGNKAIEILCPPHCFDACFMDTQMPEMDVYVYFDFYLRYLSIANFNLPSNGLKEAIHGKYDTESLFAVLILHRKFVKKSILSMIEFNKVKQSITEAVEKKSNRHVSILYKGLVKITSTPFS